ncbi:MAG: VOC family protein [Dysgonomonas sp.]|nr:VOC family protein [Dysgonomonas sp.]
MILKNCTPNLMVKDVNKTVEFYTEKLGFDFITSNPETGIWEFAIVKSGDVMFMFQQEKSIKEEYPQLEKFAQGGGLTFFIRVSDIDALYIQLKDKVTIASDMHKTFYNTNEFAIEDCNGYILTFAENI